VFEFEYDDRLRVIKEIQHVYGQEINTKYIYDSQDRLISQEGISELDYIFDEQGKIKKIPGFITNSEYNAFGSILNRSYDNGLVQQFGYDEEDNRLRNILINNIQNLTYNYDKVGNIVSIIDPINRRNHYLSYDNLNRLVEATIGDDVYKYSYNPLGNMMKIVHNDESKKFVYQGEQAHAPSKIIEGDAGVDVHSPREFDTELKSRVTEFWLLNDKNISISTNVSVDFGDGNSFSDKDLNLANNIWFIVENNYTDGGDYSVNITADSSGISDNQRYDIKFGTRASELKTLNTDASVRTFEFVVENDLNDMVYNVSWNCSDGIDSIYFTDMTSKQKLYDYIQHNYSSPGAKMFTCTVVSNDGTESKTIQFTLNGIEVEDYDILSNNASRRVVSYEVRNYFTPMETNILMQDETGSYSEKANLNTEESIFVFVEQNFSEDGAKTFSIDLLSTNYSNRYEESFSIKGVSIENYDRYAKTHTSQVISFDVRNNWNPSDVTWSLSDPSISNSSHLNKDESLMVMIEEEYDQGNKEAVVSAQSSSYTDRLTDYFIVQPLLIESLLTLSEGESSVSEMVVKNNLDNMQTFNWQFNSGEENLSSDYPLNISGQAQIYIETNYTAEGVYRTSASVNSTEYSDIATGVVVR